MNNRDLKKVGYSQEEAYFHEVNQKLIEENRIRNGQSNVIPFKPKNSPKTPGRPLGASGKKAA